MCFSEAEGGHEFLELRFPTKLYVTGVDIYEVFAVGAVVKVATATTYDDDNTVPCEGETCSDSTSWTTIWQGDPAPRTDDQAVVTSPPVCPMAYATDLLRIELQTDAVAGWNTIDAVGLKGTLEALAGLVLASPDAEQPNMIEYRPWAGVHGRDGLEYAVTDCLGWGPSVPVGITVPPPGVNFSTAFAYDVKTAAPFTTFPLEVALKGAMATIVKAFGEEQLVRVEVKASLALELDGASANVGSQVWLSTDATTFALGDAQRTSTRSAPAKLELWLTPESNPTATFRVQVGRGIFTHLSILMNFQ